MIVCYKCRTPYMNSDKPGFNEVCDGCGSYLHCCSNCKFYDEYSRPHCTEPNTDETLDPNGQNYCEYLVFKAARGMPLDDLDDPEQRRMKRRPDWRNTHKNGNSDGGLFKGGGQKRPDGVGSEERAKRARSELDRLFGK